MEIVFKRMTSSKIKGVTCTSFLLSHKRRFSSFSFFASLNGFNPVPRARVTTQRAKEGKSFFSFRKEYANLRVMDVTKRKKKKDSLFFSSSKGSFCLFNYSDSGAAI